MSQVGVEAISAFCGLACIDVQEFYKARGLDETRMRNLMLRSKSVALPHEDAVTYAVNAAAPLVEGLSEQERAGIELLVVASESGLDYSKSLGTWIHQLLELPGNCRLFEVKQACYAGVAALQLAACSLAAARRPTAKALVIATDVPRLARSSMFELSQGAGAVAVLVSRNPVLLVAEPGAAGYHSFDVSDVRRPTPLEQFCDTDVSLLSYLQCLNGAIIDYQDRVPGTDLRADFDHLVLHTPFPGAVKGFHRSLMRSLGARSAAEVAEDFARRVAQSQHYPALVGNIYAGTTLLALLSLLDHVKAAQRDRRIGIFSYGSGCSSEFCSYVLPAPGGPAAHYPDLAAAIDARIRLEIGEYDEIADQYDKLDAGAADYQPDLASLDRFLPAHRGGLPLVILEAVRQHKRIYNQAGGQA
jgi:polyketide biosynthesis 3-hydroxy-3-methylglutaryl-CoA synthase-like enzyme PksG